jgi:hypothetical protein
MTKKRIIISVYFLLIGLIGLPQVVISKETNLLHPRNQVLQKLNLVIPPRLEWKHPEIPRITADEARQYHQSGIGFFIWIGDSGGLVPGGIHLTSYEAARIDPHKLLIGSDKIIILYCY